MTTPPAGGAPPAPPESPAPEPGVPDSGGPSTGAPAAAPAAPPEPAPAPAPPPAPPPDPAPVASTPEPSPPPGAAPPGRRARWDHLAWAMGYEVWVVLMTAVVVAVLAFAVFQGRFLDLYVKLRPNAPTSGEVALLAIGGEALYLWDPSDPEPEVTPRALLAEMVRFLDAAGARVIVLDFLLDQPAPGDEALAGAARAHGRVVAAERLQVDDPASGRRFVAGVNPTLLGAVHGGFANFQVEQDTLFSQALLVRRVPLIAVADRAHLAGPWPLNQVGGRQDVEQVVPAMSLLAAALQRGLEPEAVQRRLQDACGGRAICAGGEVDLGLPPAGRPLTEPLPINFRGPEHADGIPAVDASRALRLAAQAALMESLGVPTGVEVPSELRAILEGRVVVVGRMDAGSSDRFTTPYSLPVPIEADMAGPRIHAQIIDTLLTGRQVREVGGLPVWAAGAALAAGVVAARRRLGDAALTAGVLATAVLAFLGGVFVFHFTDGVSVDLGPPLLGLLGALFAVLLGGWVTAQERSAT